MPETDIPINMIPGRHQAARRAADAFLRALGAEQITLRVSDPSTGDTNSQLGITTPTASDVQIAPAVVQVAQPAPDGTRRVQVMLSAKGLQPIADSYGVTDIPTWLLNSQGLVFRGQLMPIKWVSSTNFAGGDYLYFLTATE
jgi:hypothetical protein